MRVLETQTHPILKRRPLAVALALAAATSVAAPAAAQVYADAGPNYVDEVIVAGPVDPDGRPARLSRTVSIGDLDLLYRGDQELLRLRVRDTARDLCRALGEDGAGSSPLVPSCEAQAMRDARPQMRLAIDQAYARARYASLDYPYDPD